MRIIVRMVDNKVNDATTPDPRCRNPLHPSSYPMKFLLKVFVVAIAAKFVLNTPQGTNSTLDKVNEMTVRDITHHVDTVFARLGATLKSMLS